MKILREIKENIESSFNYWVVIEELAVFIRWVNNDYDKFIDMHLLCSTTPENIYNIIIHVLWSLELSLNKARGKIYDGAASMMGH